jgi:DNA adenine methylase
MLYQGSKARIGASIAKVIKKFNYSTFTEPFCGGLNLTQHMGVGRLKYCSDINPYLIAMWEKVLYEDWKGPEPWDEDFHKYVRDHKDEFEPHIVGWVGFCSFGGKFFDSYRRDSTNTRDYQEEYRTSILKQKEALRYYNVILSCGSYQDQLIRPDTLVYCDPPYRGTKQYNTVFDFDKFDNWCREISQTNIVLISEYSMPHDFKLVWASTRTSTLRSSRGSSHQENLYMHVSQYKGYLG